MENIVPRLRQVVIDTMHARSSAEFWRQLLGLKYRTGHEHAAGAPQRRLVAVA